MNKFVAICITGLLFMLAPFSTYAQIAHPSRAQKAERRALLQQRSRTQSQEIQKMPNFGQIQNAAGDVVTLYGYIASSWDYDNGLYHFTTSSTVDYVLERSDVNAKGGGTWYDGKYYCIGLDEVNNVAYLNVYDTEDGWKKVQNTQYVYEEGSSSNKTWQAADMTYDPSTGKIYGCFMDTGYDNYTFGILNPETAKVTFIGGKCDPMSTVSATKDGDLYAIIRDTGKMVYLDKATGAATEIGDASPIVSGSPVSLAWAQSATFDWDTGILYWAAYYGNGDSGIWSITLNGKGSSATIAEKKLLKDLGENGSWTCEEFTGLFIKRSAKTQGAPEQATNLAATFSGASLTGEISFVMPSKDNESNDLTATQLSYTMTVAGQTFTGNALGGATVKVPVTVAANGLYTVNVKVANGSAESLPAELSVFIGQDTPGAVTDATLTADGLDVTVTWTAPTAGANGGYIGDLTYNVTRFPGGVKVGSVNTTTFTETLTDNVRRAYYYEITAESAGLTSARVATNILTIGSIQGAPYHESFTDITGMDGYEVIDVNRDGSTWAYNPVDNPYTMWRQNVMYTYSEINAADDWLILPGLMLTSDNIYKFSMSLQSTLEQTIRVMVGTKAEIASLTTEVIPVSTHEGNYYAPEIFDGTFRPEADGVYYFAIHATSFANSSDMFIDDISVDVIPATRPGKVENLVVTPGAKGALNADITFNAPTKRINGEALQTLSAIKVFRDGTLIKTFDNVAAGAECTYHDPNPNNSLHEYTVTAFNEEGEGETSIVKAYTGTDVPGPIRNLKVVEDWQNEPGTMIISWDPPTEVGQNGGYVDVNALTYFDLAAGTSDRNLGSVTTFREKIDISKGQAAAAYCIYADNATGSGKNVRVVASGIAGPAVVAPLYESFKDISVKSGPWVPTVTNGSVSDAWWDICDGTALPSGTQDNDGGVTFFGTERVGFSSLNRSPKIDISETTKPALVFYLWHTGTKDVLNVKISKEFGAWENMQTIVLNEKAKGWHRYEISLADYRESAFIQVGFEGVSVESMNTILSLDNISIRDLINCDVAVSELTAPKTMTVGEESTLSFTVSNRGITDLTADDYSIELYKNKNLVKTVPGIVVPTDRSMTMSIIDIPTINDTENTTYYVKAVCANDEVLDNNTSNSKTVRVNMPLFPAVVDLTAGSRKNGVELNWSEPNTADMPANPQTDDFESYRDFIISNIGKWKTADIDGSKTILLTLNGVDPLQYENAGLPMAYQVFNPSAAGLGLKSWQPYSGNKMLVAFSASAGNSDSRAPQNNDWLISPELNGKAQKVSFFAKAANTQAPESFEVLFSKTDANVESFTIDPEHGAYTTNSALDWNEYRVNVPEGTKYFAIRCISDNKIALMVDDITYTPAGAIAEEVTIMGYNIYRNGTKLNTEPEGEAWYIDADVEDGQTYSYKVTTVYDKGESVYSNECTVVYSKASVADIEATAATITVENGRIVVRNANGMAIKAFNALGMSIYDAVGSDINYIDAANGVYIVTVGTSKAKVIVR